MLKGKTPPQVLLGFDFGMRKIGIAVGQAITQTATPLSNIQAKDGIPNWELIEALITTWKAEALVVGIPYNTDGSEQEISFAARKFAARLKARYHLPVFLTDERLTTIEAKIVLKGRRVTGVEEHDVDCVAAKLILESWFRG